MTRAEPKPDGARARLIALAIVIAVSMGLPVVRAQAGLEFYSAFVSHRPMGTSCVPMPDLGNLSYRFRTGGYPGDQVLTLRNGQFDDRRGATDSFDPPEFHTEIERQDPIELAGRPAVIVQIFSSHMRGSGSATHLLVLRCYSGQLEIVFEAGAEGLGATWTPSELRVTHPVWMPGDSHAGPSQLVEEVFEWRQHMDHFKRLRRSQRPIGRSGKSSVVSPHVRR